MASGTAIEASVPLAFAAYLRRRRLMASVVSAIFAIAAGTVVAALLSAISHRPADYMVAFSVGIGYPLAALFLGAATARSPLVYIITPKFICTGVAGGVWKGSNPGRASVGLFIDFRRDPLTGVVRHHWRGLPALLIFTRKNLRGFLLAFEREAIDAVEAYLWEQVPIERAG